MEYGVMLPFIGAGNRNEVLQWATRAEKEGFRTIRVGERIAYSNSMDQIAILAAVTAVTSKIRILTGVTLIPIHPPAMLAKAFATLDVLSEGRFVCTAGVGNRLIDYRMGEAEHKFARRWTYANEAILAMQRIWKGEPLNLGDDIVGPKPYTPGGPDIWIGSKGPKALAHAARWGSNGYYGYTSVDNVIEMKAQLAHVDRIWTENGRTDMPYKFLGCQVALGEKAKENMAVMIKQYWNWDTKTSDSPVPNITSVDQVRRLIDSAQEAGFDEVSFTPVVGEIEEFDRLSEIIAKL